MKAVVYLLLVIVMTSCSANWHLKKSKYHELKAIAKGAQVNVDTVYEERRFKFPAVEVKFEPKLVGDADKYKTPIILKKDSIRVEIRWRKGVDRIDTLLVDAKCPEQDTVIRTPVSVERELSPKRINLGLVFLVGFIVGIIVVVLLTKYISVQIRK